MEKVLKGRQMVGILNKELKDLNLSTVVVKGLHRLIMVYGSET